MILTVCKEKKDDFNVTSKSIYNDNFNFSILKRPVTIKYKRNKYSITFLPEHDKLGDFLNKNEKVYVQQIDDKIRSFVEPYGMRIDDIIDSVSTKVGTNEVQYKVNDLNKQSITLLKQRPVTITFLRGIPIKEIKPKKEIKPEKEIKPKKEKVAPTDVIARIATIKKTDLAIIAPAGSRPGQFIQESTIYGPVRCRIPTGIRAGMDFTITIVKTMYVVTVPYWAKPGQVVSVRTQHGNVQVAIPPDAKGGTDLQFSQVVYFG